MAKVHDFIKAWQNMSIILCAPFQREACLWLDGEWGGKEREEREERLDVGKFDGM